MLLDSILSSGALPSLEQSIRFAAGRQKLIAHNIANISTPNFQQKDVAPEDFQAWLADAIADRRKRTGGMHGELHTKPTRQIRRLPDGRLELDPRSPAGGILAHDRNNRDLEQLMQDMTENLSAYRLATDLMRSQMDILRVSITQRV